MVSTDRLMRLHAEHGQSPWLDNLKRSLITSGDLAGIRDAGVRGLTSNPTIFQKAIQGSADYDEQFRSLISADNSIIDCYWAMVLKDIHGALDVFESVYKNSNGGDGFVSVEVDPNLAHDHSATLLAGQHLWETVSRAHLMVKIPATVPCLESVQAMISAGRNVNVTLIFSLDRYQKVMDAFIAGLEERLDAGLSINGISSVASFFISRVDAEVDKRLDLIGTPAALALRGRAAIAQAKLAYERFRTTFSGERWETLAQQGASVQRPLWASTSTKNPSYPDTLYVDELIGHDSVNTLPDATLEAFADHGTLRTTIDQNVHESHRVWVALAEVGVDMDDVARQLEDEGVLSFQKSFDELLAALNDKAQTF